MFQQPPGRWRKNRTKSEKQERKNSMIKKLLKIGAGLAASLAMTTQVQAGWGGVVADFNTTNVLAAATAAQYSFTSYPTNIAGSNRSSIS